jgi:hypothetical protein
MNKANQNAVIVKVLDDLLDRAKAEKNKHGSVLRSHDGCDGLFNAYTQALDMVIYLKKEIMERESEDKNIKVVPLFPPQLPAA